MTLRTDQDDAAPPHQPRLNLLLSYGRGHDQSVMEQLPRLLAPMGIRSIRVASGRDAAEAVETLAIHIAVVDLTVPLEERPGAREAGSRILQLLRRMAQPPPTVVVRPPQPVARQSARGLVEALRQGAFTVLDRPLHLETLLEVMRRILRRHYAGRWPVA